MEIKETKKLAKNLQKYFCKKCDFVCSQKCDWDRHVLTRKHKMETDGNHLETKKTCKKFSCGCGKNFSSKSGLWKHKQKCSYEESSQLNDTNDTNYNINDIEIKDKDGLVLHLLKQNSELQHKIINIASHTTITNNNSNNITTNTFNKSFNLNLFLNETCKDALNMSEFIDSIRLNLSDLENTGQKGYIEGVSNIILNKLNDLEQHERPIHCNDQKREILYIKDNDEWTKESDDKPILTRAINTITNENIKQIKEWREKHPDCINSDSKKNNMYLKIVSNSMNGSNKEESQKNVNKIISNIARVTVIKKRFNDVIYSM